MKVMISVKEVVLPSLIQGFIVALILELGFQVLVLLGYSKPFVGIVLVIFWCVYANYIFGSRSKETVLQDMMMSLFLATFFVVVAWLVTFIQGFVFKGFYGFIFGLSLLINWVARFGVRGSKRM